MTKTARRCRQPSMAFAAALALGLTAPGSGAATVVRIENAAPLEDHSERAIGRAIQRAVDDSMRGATTLGLSSIQLSDAVVLKDRVLVRVVASDEDAAPVQDDRADEEIAVLDIAGTSEPR